MPNDPVRFTSLPLAVNCSMLLTDVPLLQRPAAARRHGFDAVEFWWPFDRAVPADEEVEQFIAAVEEAGVALVNLNLFAGDMAAGERGLICWPGRADEFEANLDVVARIGERLGCGRFNALYGNRIDGVSADVQDELGAARLAEAARRVAEFGGVIVVEPLSGLPSYPLRTAQDVIAVLDRAGEPNIGLLADLYHLSVNGEHTDDVVADHTDRIAHVQIADAPGRGKPGTGALPLGTQLASLEANGYSGWVALEYVSCGHAEADFDWLPLDHRA